VVIPTIFYSLCCVISVKTQTVIVILPRNRFGGKLATATLFFLFGGKIQNHIFPTNFCGMLLIHVVRDLLTVML